MLPLPFYAETSSFQLYTAMAFALASAFLLSTKRNSWEYTMAGIVSLYIAFDERFMFHECIRLRFPSSSRVVGGDLTVFLLAVGGILGVLWGIRKLSRSRFETYLFLLAGCVCFTEIYLDVFEKTIFYLELDTKIEELAEMMLAIILILIGLCAGVRWRVIILAIVFITLLVWLEHPLREFMWSVCPKLRSIL